MKQHEKQAARLVADNLLHYHCGILPPWKDDLIDHLGIESLQAEAILDEGWDLYSQERHHEKVSPAATNTTSSSSLLFSFTAGPPPTFFRIETLQAAVTPEEQLQVLQSVEYMEDVCLGEDWSTTIQSVLQQGLQSHPDAFVALHRQWYGQLRPLTGEMVPAAQDLLTNLLQAVEDDRTPSALPAWHAVWMDFWHIQQQVDDNLDLVKRVLAWDSTIVARLLELDPQARWWKVAVWRRSPTDLASFLLEPWVSWGASRWYMVHAVVEVTRTAPEGLRQQLQQAVEQNSICSETLAILTGEQ